MNILIFRVGSIGDSIVALDAVYTIKMNNSRSKIFILCNKNDQASNGTESVYSVLSIFGLSDGCFEYSKTIDLIKINKYLKNNNITKLYYLMPKRNFFQKIRDKIIFRLMGLNAQGINLFDSDENKYTKNYVYESESQRLLRKLSGLEKHSFNYEIIGKKENKNAITICIGTRHVVNDWGIENWSKLIKLIFYKQDDAIINIIGGGFDVDNANYLRKIKINSINNYCGELGILESIELIANSRVYIGHDSGAMHLASLTQTPIVVLFSNKNKPGIWNPVCKNASILRNKMIREINPWCVCDIALGVSSTHNVQALEL